MLQKWCSKTMDPAELKKGFKQLGVNLDTLDYVDDAK
jgi:NACalpha-BTF3-like transcription factor